MKKELIVNFREIRFVSFDCLIFGDFLVTPGFHFTFGFLEFRTCVRSVRVPTYEFLYACWIRVV